MQLYDKDIASLKNRIEEFPFVKISGTEESSSGLKKARQENNEWPVNRKEKLILRSETAYELGGGELAAVSGLAFTFSKELVAKDGVYLCGKDLAAISKDLAYARITLLRLSEKLLYEEEQSLYNILQKIEYMRYHFFPEGYMMRISPAREREPVRVSKAAIKQGISFAKIGQCFQNAYRKLPEVEAVETYFITLPEFPYTELKRQAHRFGQITQSLNHIFENLTMDCSTCGLKEICDQVEGLKELHFGRTF